MRKKIIILSGDPNSINSEIIYKSWIKLNNSIKKKLFLVTNLNLFNHQLDILNLKLKLSKVKNLNDKILDNSLKIIDIDINYKNPFKVDKTEASRFVLKSLNFAHDLALKNKNVVGFVNCAINKNLLGKSKLGVTEYLAQRCNIKDNSEVMLITNNSLSVCPITTHIDINQITQKIQPKLIEKKIDTINNWFKKKYRRKPKIGLLGLNPHNSEMRKNSIEKKIIFPTILRIKRKGVNLRGPLVSDTIFINEYKKYDVVVGMYHDQVLSPFKALFGFNAINVTLGLKYLRASPDHGTALDKIKKNKADPQSLLECIKFINNS